MAGTEARTRAENRIENLRLEGGIFVEAVRATRMAMAVTDPTLPGNPIVFANRSFLKLSGYTMDEVLGQKPHFLNGPDTDPDDVARFEEALRSDQDDLVETIQYRKDGTRFIASVLLSAFKDDKGETVHHFLSWLDVTRRQNAENRLALLQQAQEALRQSEHRAESALLAAEMGTWDYDLIADVCHFDARARELYNLPSGQLDHRPEGVTSVVHPDDIGPMFDEIQRATDLDGEGRYDINYRIARADGTYRWLRAVGITEFEGSGESRRATRIVGASRDITIERDAETALRESEARLARDLADSRALQAAGQAMIDTSREDEAETAILAAALEIMGSDAASMQWLDPATGELVLLAHVGFHPDSAAFWARVTRDNGGTCGQSLSERQRVIVEDVCRDPVLSASDDLQWYQRSDIVAVQTTPLITRGGQIVGMISTHWKRRHRPSERELGHFDVLARQAADLIERRAAEVALDRERQRQQTLLAELQHRVRNILAMIRSMVVRASANKTDVHDFVSHLQGRISAMARTQAILTRSPGRDVDLEQILRDEMLADATREGKVKLSGRPVSLSPKAAEVLTLALHELSTNSLKYGALGGEGKVAVSWKLAARDGRDWLSLTWRETEVAISNLEPTPGFGTELITQRVPYELGGTSKMDFGSDGLKATMEFPLNGGGSVLQTDGALKQEAAE